MNPKVTVISYICLYMLYNIYSYFQMEFKVDCNQKSKFWKGKDNILYILELEKILEKF